MSAVVISSTSRTAIRSEQKTSAWLSRDVKSRSGPHLQTRVHGVENGRYGRKEDRDGAPGEQDAEH